MMKSLITCTELCLAAPNDFSGQCEYDIVILVDSTEGISPTNWQWLLEMLRLMVTKIDSLTTLGVTSRVAIISYADDAISEIPLEANLTRQGVLYKIDNGEITYQVGARFMVAAIELARDILFDNMRTIDRDILATQSVILFSNGQPISPVQVYTVAQYLANMAAEVVKVQVMMESMMLQGVYVNLIGQFEFSPCFMQLLHPKSFLVRDNLLFLPR